MNRFWDLIEAAKAPGLRAHRTDAASGSTMGGWYSPRALYVPEELGGLPVEKFVEALAAEGVISGNFDPHMTPACRAPPTAGNAPSATTTARRSGPARARRR